MHKNHHVNETDDRRALQSIAIVGGGMHAWTIAAALARKYYKQATTITVVEIDGEHDHVLGESSLPALQYFHRFLGLNEHQLIKVTQSSYKLASEYKDWTFNETSSQGTASFFHAMSPYGCMIDDIAFQHHLIKLHQSGVNFDLADFSLPATAAKQGKFNKPNASQHTLPFSYALHIEVKRYADGMQDFAKKLGVKHISGALSVVNTTLIGKKPNTSKHIHSLTMQNGDNISAELFIDCTHKGRLIKGSMQVGSIDYLDYLPCNKMITYSSQAQSESKPVTLMQIHECGWQRSFPLQDKTVHEYFYSSEFQSEEEALVCIHAQTGLDIANINHSEQTNRRVETFWSGNCVAMGNACGNLGRYAASNFHLVQSAILRLFDLMPDSALTKSTGYKCRDEYNHLCEEEYSRILDYHCSHYAIPVQLATAELSPFWLARKNAPMPESLAHKLRLFGATGRVPFYERETFAEKTWVSFMLGLGLWPKQYDHLLDMPRADKNERNKQRSKEVLTKFINTNLQISKQMPTHAQYLAHYCKAKHKRKAV